MGRGARADCTLGRDHTRAEVQVRAEGELPRRRRVRKAVRDHVEVVAEGPSRARRVDRTLSRGRPGRSGLRHTQGRGPQPRAWACSGTTNRRASRSTCAGRARRTCTRRVTLADELTHVLQDQYFDLEKRDAEMDKSKTASSDAFRAIVEGDAVSVQNEYLKAQNKAFNDEYQRESKKFGAQDTARSKDVPAAVSVELQAPYLFGPPVIDVLTADDPHGAVNEILKSGEPTTRIFSIQRSPQCAEHCRWRRSCGPVRSRARSRRTTASTASRCSSCWRRASMR